MDLSNMLIQIFAPMLSAYWWMIPLIIMFSILQRPFMKGVIGEFQVNLIAKFWLDKEVYHLIKNVTLPTENGTTQIDHVIVSKFGVFVIETKNMKGWIFGNANQKMWTQQIYKHKTQFQNPLHQNFKHTQTLQSALELEPEKIFSLVVFIGDSDFKTQMPDNIVYAGGYISFIKSKTKPVLSDFEVLNICKKIESGRLTPSIKTHLAHVNHVKTLVEQTQQTRNDNVCPKCGKSMVIRTARKGENQGKEFWGCSGFPNCRTVKPIS
jgi:predicted RNA-binding Zn-ribbon protein involved in translation (DUF1610 family)